jgi:signal transduction histidine kinase/Na+-transporting methylmalonyl-CoA/oxaloacetate decarboxylase gamma subunit
VLSRAEVAGMKSRLKIPLALKLSMTFALLFLSIMALVLYSVQQIISIQFTEQYYRDARFAVQSLQRDLQMRREIITSHLRQLAVKIEDDNDFRLYVHVLEDYAQPLIVDYAPEYMPTMGLHALHIIDDRGVVLSSGHFRNAFGKETGQLINQLRAEGKNPTLGWFQQPDRNVLCLTAMDSVRIGTKKYFLVGGTEFTDETLARMKYKERDYIVLSLSGSTVISSDTLPEGSFLGDQLHEQEENPEGYAGWLAENFTFESFQLALLSETDRQVATISYLHPKDELIMLIANLNIRLIMIAGIGIIVIVLSSVWRSYSITGPLQRLAAVAENISLDQAEDTFSIKSRDEVGVLNNALKDMVGRLRKSSLDLAEAEQKAAFADLARKVNHDIKNGFIPIRNVMRHWSEVAHNDPSQLPRVFNERKETVSDSITYLENLAREYSRIRQPRGTKPLEMNSLVNDLIRNYTVGNGQNLKISVDPAPKSMYILGEAIHIRRALDNVLRNAIDSIEGDGIVAVSIREAKGSVIIAIRDTGTGISEEVQEKLFITSITTKADGTGIGLMNVKNICEQYGGSVHIESTEGEGTTVTLTFPTTSHENKTEQVKSEDTDRSI